MQIQYVNAVDEEVLPITQYQVHSVVLSRNVILFRENGNTGPEDIIKNIVVVTPPIICFTWYPVQLYRYSECIVILYIRLEENQDCKKLLTVILFNTF